MKILVASNFSKLSNNAALYAAKFAKKANSEIILLHVDHVASPPMIQITQYIERKIEDIRVSTASQNCIILANELKSKVKKLKISFKVISGHPLENIIEDYAITNGVDLIVMGTKESSGLGKVLFGNNTVSVVNKSSIPVITVPEYSRFNQLKHIVYASDMDNIEFEIQQLIPIAQLFDSSIHILHVLPINSNKNIDIDNIKNHLVKKYKYNNISFHISYNDDIIVSIDEFVADIKADLLAMHTHKIGFFEKLLKTNLNREEAFHSLIPLLTLKN